MNDREVPPSRSHFRGLAAEFLGELRGGRGVLVHCRQGIGRASLLAAATLVASETDPRAALALIERARGRPVPAQVAARSRSTFDRRPNLSMSPWAVAPSSARSPSFGDAASASVPGLYV